MNYEEEEEVTDIKLPKIDENFRRKCKSSSGVTKPCGDFPVTTAREIGWKASKPDWQLEIYGSRAKGKMGLLKRLNWPIQGI